MFDITWLAGHAKTNFHHHSSTTPLITKSGSKTTLSDLVKSSTPPCRLNPLLFNGHLQTMYTAVKEAGPPVYYKRHIFESTHTVYPGQFVVDFVVPPSVGKESTPNPELPERTTFYSAKEIEQIGKDDEKPMLICLHGLSGGSHEIYLRHVVAPITAAGWECCVVNARGCALSKVTTPHLFNARSTWDLRQTVKWLRQTFPNRPLYAVGFSMGANILSNFCGEEGANCELKAAVSCSNPWNLELSHWALRRTWIGHGLYLKVLGKSVVGLYEKNKEVVLQNKKIDHEKVMQCKYLYEFDRAVQCPTWGYPTEGCYYRDASSSDAVTAIRIPFVGINAEDDPISSYEAIPYEEFKLNPSTVLVTTNWGGHLSWFQVGGKRWFATAICEIFMKMHNDVDTSATPKPVESKADRKYPIWDPSNRRLGVPL